MIAPTRRLIALSLAAFLPAATLALYPGPASGASAALGSLLVALALIDAVSSRPRLGRVELGVAARLRAVAREPLQVAVRLTSSARRPIYLRVLLEADVTLGGAASAESAVLEATRPCTLEFELMPARRGRAKLQAFWLEARSHLGLWVMRERRPVNCRVDVHPNLARSGRARRAELGRPGLRDRPPAGGKHEIERLREYLPGDPVEHIHWKMSARRAKTITKLFRCERARRVLVAVDVSNQSRLLAGASDGRREALLERFARSALSLCQAAERRGDAYGLVLFHGMVSRHLPLGSGARQLVACREALLDLESEATAADFSALFAFLAERLTRRTLVVIVTSTSDPLAAEELVRRAALLASQQLVMLAVASDGELVPVLSRPVQNIEQAYQQLAAHFAWRERHRFELSLQRADRRLLFSELDESGSNLTLEYLKLRRRGLS